MDYIDILISVIQSILFFYMINYCLEEVKIDNKKIILYVILFSVIIIIIPKLLQSILLSSFLTHICTLVLTISMFFRQKYKNAFITYSLIYSIIVLWVFLFGNLLHGILKEILQINHIEIITVITMYLSQVVLLILCYVFRFKIKQICRMLAYENIPVSYIIAVSFIPDFLNSFYFISYDIDDSHFRYVVYIVLFIFLIVNAYYFNKIIKEANVINNLNKALTSKNDELKKIKNDYGLQIACLYELCDMEKYDEVASLLKSTINQTGADISDNSVNKTSLLSLATKHIDSDDINVVIEDNANFRLVAINEMELYRILVNIVDNAKRAMRNKGTLIAKSFQDLKNIVIIIENDGEKIPKEVIDRIFDLGFTTKENRNKNHGYGLSIAKELIENHNGKILVKSSKTTTKFTITLPKKSYI